MAENTRTTRSTRGRGNNDIQTDAQFWSTVPDPMDIERGRTEAIDMAYAAATNLNGSGILNQQEPMAEIGNINEVTNYTASTIPQATAPLTYVNDNEYDGLEEQLLTEDEATDEEVQEGEVADITANRVVTPQGMQTSDGPLNPMYTQQTAGREMDLDMQPSRGPKNPDTSVGEALNAYMDDDYNDILRTSQMKTSFSLLSLNNTTASRPPMPLGWIIPDGTNRTLEEVDEKKIANGMSPGGGSGAVIASLPRLEEHFTTKYYLVDLDTGEVFAYVGQLWRRTGLYCAVQPFNMTELKLKIERYSRAMKMEIENEQQTPVTPLVTRTQAYTPTPLPPMDDPAIYVIHPDVMTTSTRRNYTRDRMRAAVTYINEYYDTQSAITQDGTHREALGTRLRIIYGRINNIRERIDEALLADDAYRRRRNMRDVPGVTRFPSPQMMNQASSTAWVSWIRDETNKAMMMLDEEMSREGDPDDPFNGTAGGVFELPPGRANSFSLPPPVHTPTAIQGTEGRQITGGGDESSTPSQPTRISGQQTAQSTTVRNGGDEQSTPSPDPNRSIRQFHAQQRQQRVQQEEATLTSTEQSQERNLITFTPSPPNSVREERTANENRIQRPNGEGQQREAPMPQREQVRKQSSSNTGSTRTTIPTGHDPPNIEEGNGLNAGEAQTSQPTTEVNDLLPEQESYLRLPIPREGMAVRKCWRCGEEGHSKKECNRQVACIFCQVYSHATRACKKYASFVRNSQGTSSKRTTPTQEEARMQGPRKPKTWYATNSYPRFQPPTVPPMLRPQMTNQVAQAPVQPRQPSPQIRHKSLQDVRDDPNYVTQETRRQESENQVQGAPQAGAVYVKYPIPIGNEMPAVLNTHPDEIPEAQPTQTQRVAQEDNTQTLQAQQKQLYAKIKQQQRQIKQMQQQHQQLQQQQWQRQIAELQRSDIHKQEKLVQQNQPRIVEGVLKPKKEEVSIRCDAPKLVNEADRPVFVNHYYAALADKAVRMKHQGKILYVIEGDEHSSLSSKSIQVGSQHPLIQPQQKEGDEHSTPSPKIVEAGLNRVNEAEQQAPYGTSNMYTQHAKTYADTQRTVVVLPAKESRGQGLEGPNETAAPNLPDVSQPPPPIHRTFEESRLGPGSTCSSKDTELLESIRDITKVMENQIRLSNRNAEEGSIQNATLLQQFIKSQQERALDPALMAIPTFTGNDRTKCLDWASRVKNVCQQSGRSFRQELINKSELLVQNYIASLNNNLSDEELMEKVLRFFSDVPTASHALDKLKQIEQAVDEPIINYNQRYKNLLERVEGRPLGEITSAAAMEMYLGSINLHIRKSIRATLFWNSKHAPKTVEEAMSKAQEIYIKHLYSTGEDSLVGVGASDQSEKPAIIVEEVQADRRSRWGPHKNGEGDEYSTPSTGNRYKGGYDSGDRKNYQRHEVSAGRKGGDDHSSLSDRQKSEERKMQLPNMIRSSYTQILVNPMQLQDHEFTAWLERLVEARRNRQENKTRPYRNYRKPYNQENATGDGSGRRPQLRSKMTPAQELDVHHIMEMYNCHYDDVVEAVDMYNLDVEECRSA